MPTVSAAAAKRTNITQRLQVTMKDFDLLKVLGTGAYGKVFLARKRGGVDAGQLFAMKVLKKATIVQKKKTTEHTKTERQVLETIRQSPFLVTMHYAFQTPSKLHLVLDYVNGGELFTHLYQREKFTENEVRIYIGEIVLALEHLHKVSVACALSPRPQVFSSVAFVSLFPPKRAVFPAKRHIMHKFPQEKKSVDTLQ